ncbi:hypothetical protein LEP1GSC045_2038 [Leptospira interrogans serovar Pomona str. Kennewicki LC82-25]|nr:hypothetical protein LEP1GSC045_2038 [Leptospira interrogans serovar Pomona str. Kennewicki LC82-25]EKN99512.1 hypothetical protein LEP1GSC014_2208 [Leptospira interrogans serovar Pomona str. Pomona]EKR81936.1 hypothetical protein LEP1GSC099_0345 [Leptospira interrogans str. UI 08452]EMF34226.1 hypothetical protein LEP1GSC201_3144 [Leptospira interrogans serovar Pomona str. Fox 32256]EMN36529.1 hypothetical protein LEP1GSC084_2858 [Leptospira interrogans serovar Medanensis str. L0448]EMN415
MVRVPTHPNFICKSIDLYKICSVKYLGSIRIGDLFFYLLIVGTITKIRIL